jgi:3',5'-cyclic-AMP phosphodiesterase
MLLCQISDLHVMAGRQRAYGVVDTADCLERCVRRIAGFAPAPDLLVATGDLVDVATPAAYGLLRELLAPLRMPVYLLPGNHDDREALRRAFPDHRYLPRQGEFLQYAVEDFPVRLLALDTVVAGRTGGGLCAQRLHWLERALDGSDAPTVIALHHPPFATGIGFMDEVALEDPAALARVVRRFPQVQRLVCGHVHRPIQALFAGTLASSCPSSAHQISLDLREGVRASFVMEPPALQLHLWAGETLVTHTACIDGFGGPHPFHD